MKDAIRNFSKMLLFLLLAAFPCFAQFTGEVQGNVVDQKGSAVPNAAVTLMNVDTGVKQMATSNGSGLYRFSSLAPGNYTVSTTVQGFAPSTVQFNLATAQTHTSQAA